MWILHYCVTTEIVMQSFKQYRKLQTPESTHGYSKHDKSVSSDDTLLGTTQTGSSKPHILVDWEGKHDQNHPRNWTLALKIVITLIIWINVFALEWCSAADSQISSKATKAYHVSKVAESLGMLHIFCCTGENIRL